MKIIQKEISISAKSKGFHLITREIEKQLPELKSIKSGIANIFIKHTSVSLTINENYDPDVREDFENYFNRVIPENPSLYFHLAEGSDDITSHIKSSVIGNSLTIPITNGKFNLGTWQGIYFGEHRNIGRIRFLLVTIIGEDE